MPRKRQDRDQTVTSKDIRESLSIYPDRKFNIFKFILESVTMTLEVFLHTKIGERYISVPKAIVGAAFMYLTIFLAIFGFSVSIHPDPTQIGGISLLKSFLESLFSFEWRKAFENLGKLITALWNPETRIDVLGPVHITVVVFSVLVNYHLLTNFLAKHSNPPRLWHPRSSGEPWPLWNWAYRFGYRYNMRIDLVKQGCEPLFCFLLGSILGNRDFTTKYLGFALPQEWQFLIAWLKIGAFALLLRAYLENRNRKKLTLDRLGNEFDGQAFELQDELYAKEPWIGEFVEAKGKRRKA